jgi:hypothetical protein
MTSTLPCPAYVLRLIDSLRHCAAVGTKIEAVWFGAVASVVPPFR